MCADKEERNQLVAKNVSLDYLDFVKVAFVAETIQFVPPKPGGSRAMTLHQGGGGIGELSSPNSDTIRSRMVTVATEWFRTFCLAKGGQVVRYPLNDPIQNADRLACHSKTDIDGQSPMFGIQVSRAVVYRVADQVPVVAMEHLGGGETVLEAWAYPKVFQVGDATAQGLVIEIKAPLVKVQRTNGDQVSEMWLPIKSLRPTVRTGAGS